jgi:hypothetical protein
MVWFLVDEKTENILCVRAPPFQRMVFFPVSFERRATTMDTQSKEERGADSRSSIQYHTLRFDLLSCQNS